MAAAPALCLDCVPLRGEQRGFVYSLKTLDSHSSTTAAPTTALRTKHRFFILVDKGYSMRSNQGSHVPWILNALGRVLSERFPTESVGAEGPTRVCLIGFADDVEKRELASVRELTAGLCSGAFGAGGYSRVLPAVRELENALTSMARARARAPGFASGFVNHLIVLTDGRAHDLPDALAAVKRMPKGTRDREAIHNLVAVRFRTGDYQAPDPRLLALFSHFCADHAPMALEDVSVAPPAPDGKAAVNAAGRRAAAQSGAIHVMLFWPGYTDDLDLRLECFAPGAARARYALWYGKPRHACGRLDVDANVDHDNAVDACENAYVWEARAGETFVVKVNWYSEGAPATDAVPYTVSVAVHGEVVFFRDGLTHTRVGVHDTVFRFTYREPGQAAAPPAECAGAYAKMGAFIVERTCGPSLFRQNRVQVALAASVGRAAGASAPPERAEVEGHDRGAVPAHFRMFRALGGVEQLTVGDQFVVLQHDAAEGAGAVDWDSPRDVARAARNLLAFADASGSVVLPQDPRLQVDVHAGAPEACTEAHVRPLVDALFRVGKWLLVAGDSAAIAPVVRLLLQLQEQFPPPPSGKGQATITLGMKRGERLGIVKDRIHARSQGLIQRVLGLLNRDSLDRLNEQQVADFLGQVAHTAAGARLAKRAGDVDVTAEVLRAAERIAQYDGPPADGGGGTAGECSFLTLESLADSAEFARALQADHKLEAASQGELLSNLGVVGYALRLHPRAVGPHPDPWAFTATGIRELWPSVFVASSDVLVGKSSGQPLVVPGTGYGGAEQKKAVEAVLPSLKTVGPELFGSAQPFAELVVSIAMRGVVAPIPRDFEAYLVAGLRYLLCWRPESAGGARGTALRTLIRDLYVKHAEATSEGAEKSAWRAPEWVDTVYHDLHNTLMTKMGLLERVYADPLKRIGSDEPRHAFTGDQHPSFYVACALRHYHSVFAADPGSPPRPSLRVQAHLPKVMRALFQFEVWCNLRRYFRTVQRIVASAAERGARLDVQAADLPTRQSIVEGLLGIDRSAQRTPVPARSESPVRHHDACDAHASFVRTVALRLPIPAEVSEGAVGASAARRTDGGDGAMRNADSDDEGKAGGGGARASSAGEGPSRRGAGSMRCADLLPDLLLYRRAYARLAAADRVEDRSYGFSYEELFGTEDFELWVVFSFVEMLRHAEEADRMKEVDDAVPHRSAAGTSASAQKESLTEDLTSSASMGAYLRQLIRAVFEAMYLADCRAAYKTEMQERARDKVRSLVACERCTREEFLCALRAPELQLDDSDLIGKKFPEAARNAAATRMSAAQLREALIRAILDQSETSAPSAATAPQELAHRLWYVVFGALPVGRIFADSTGADVKCGRSYLGDRYPAIFEFFRNVGGPLEALARDAFRRVPKTLSYNGRVTAAGYSDDNPSSTALGFTNDRQLVRAVNAGAEDGVHLGSSCGAGDGGDHSRGTLQLESLIDRAVKRLCVNQLMVFWPRHVNKRTAKCGDRVPPRPSGPTLGGIADDFYGSDDTNGFVAKVCNGVHSRVRGPDGRSWQSLPANQVVVPSLLRLAGCDAEGTLPEAGDQLVIAQYSRRGGHRSCNLAKVLGVRVKDGLGTEGACDDRMPVDDDRGAPTHLSLLLELQGADADVEQQRMSRYRHSSLILGAKRGVSAQPAPATLATAASKLALRNLVELLRVADQYHCRDPNMQTWRPIEPTEYERWLRHAPACAAGPFR